MRYGIPPSGAMDQYSYQVGNLIVGNPEGFASLEISLYGLILEAISTVTVAITGGDLSPLLNGTPALHWTRLVLQKGDVLHFKKRVKGFRAYLAVRGGLIVPEILNSKSTFLRGKIGTALKKGDLLSIGDFGLQPPGDFPVTLPKEYIPDLVSNDPVLVLMGPQEDYYTPKGIETFLNSPYRITSQSDRMGYRTEGPPIEVAKGPGIITEPIPRGSIQVPGDGKPIILLRDAQVTGGYGKIATVVSAHMDRLGQRAPGDTLRFQKISRDHAIDMMLEEKRKWDALRRLFVP